MEAAGKLTITMPPDMIRDLRASVAAGEYGSTSEAIRDALRVWHRQRIENAERLTAIRARIRRSLDDPRPDMTLEEVDTALDAAFARAEQASTNGAA